MNIGFYAGSFSPPSIGHEHVIKIASKLFDKLYVGIGVNADKKYDFSFDERREMVGKSIEYLGLTNVDIISYDDLLFEAANRVNAKFIIRGLRTISDFDYEFTLNDFNKMFNSELETIFIMAPKEFLTISSTNIRYAAKAKLNVDKWVSPPIAEMLKVKFQ